MTLNDLERRNGPYFALFHRSRVRCRRETIIRPTSVSKSTFDIVYDHINTICGRVGWTSPILRWRILQRADNSV